MYFIVWYIVSVHVTGCVLEFQSWACSGSISSFDSCHFFTTIHHLANLKKLKLKARWLELSRLVNMLGQAQVKHRWFFLLFFFLCSGQFDFSTSETLSAFQTAITQECYLSAGALAGASLCGHMLGTHGDVLLHPLFTLIMSSLPSVLMKF